MILVLEKYIYEKGHPSCACLYEGGGQRGASVVHHVYTYLDVSSLISLLLSRYNNNIYIYTPHNTTVCARPLLFLLLLFYFFIVLDPFWWWCGHDVSSFFSFFLSLVYYPRAYFISRRKAYFNPGIAHVFYYTDSVGISISRLIRRDFWVYCDRELILSGPPVIDQIFSGKASWNSTRQSQPLSFLFKFFGWFGVFLPIWF